MKLSEIPVGGLFRLAGKLYRREPASGLNYGWLLCSRMEWPHKGERVWLEPDEPVSAEAGK